MIDWLKQTLDFCISAWISLADTDRALALIAVAVILSFTATDIITNLLKRKGKQDLGSLRKAPHKKAKGIRFGCLETRLYIVLLKPRGT